MDRKEVHCMEFGPDMAVGVAIEVERVQLLNSFCRGRLKTR